MIRLPQTYSKPTDFEYMAGKKGYTLLELLLVIAILSLTIALVSPYVTGGLSNTRLKTTAKKMAATFNYAKNRSSRERQNYYVEVQKDKLIVSGKNDGKKKEISIPAELIVTASDSPVIVFYPRGSSSGGVFELGDGKKGSLFTVRVEPSTGTVTVKEGPYVQGS